MPGLTRVGECEYNGYAFDATSVAKVNVEYVRDDAGRTIIYQKHTLTVEAVVAADPACDSDLETIREKLSAPGKRLKFTNRGFGTDVDVGPGGNLEDVKYGPFPSVLSWECLGGNRAAAISWQVVFCISMCDSPGKSKAAAVMALNYDTAFAVDKHGDTTRTITGYVEVKIPRNGRNVPFTAEDYLNRILIQPMPGFDRTVTRRTSLDRARCDFTVTDAQIPSRNPLPPNMIVASGRHRVRWGRGGKQTAYLRNSLSVELTPQNGLSPAQCWKVFVDILRLRTGAAIKNQRGVLLDELEAEEDIFGRPCSFSASWRVLGCLHDFLGDSGIWQPLGTDWGRWSTSLNLNYFGTANLHAAPDVIVDLCASADAQVLLSSPLLERHGGMPSGSYVNPMPTPSQSYLDYQMSVVVDRELPTSRQAVMQSPETDYAGGQISNMADQTTQEYPRREGTDDLIQVGGRPRYSFRLVGQARRVGYPVPRPTVSKIGEADPIERQSTFVQRPESNMLGVPVYQAAWNISYDSAYSPGKVSQSPNLENCIDEQGKATKPKE